MIFCRQEDSVIMLKKIFALLVIFAGTIFAAEAVQKTIPPDEIIRNISSELHSGENWFSCEKHALLIFAGKFFLIAAVEILILILFRTLKKCFIRKNSSWKFQLFYALFPPVLIAAGIAGSFFSGQELLKTVPEIVYKLILQGFYSLLTVCVAWGIVRMISVADQKLRRFAEHNDHNLDNLTVGMLCSTLKAAVILTAFLFIGQNIYDFNITALLASAGVIGLALALAAKDTVSNFFGTMVIIADSPFRIGDEIDTGKIRGIVRSVGIRSSRIITHDESICTVPNSELTATALSKVSSRGTLKKVMTIGLTYDTPPEKMVQAIKILHEIADDFHGPDAPGKQPHIFFESFGEFSLNITMIIYLKTSSFAEEEILLNELNMAVLERFNAAGLAFAFPTRTIFLRQNQ